MFCELFFSTTFKIMGPPKTMVKKKLKRWNCFFTGTSSTACVWCQLLVVMLS